MNRKLVVVNWLRGWLPQEPYLPHQTAPSTTKPANATKANILYTAVSLIAVFGLFASFFLLASSWIKDVLITTAIIGGLVYVVGRRRPRIKRGVIKALVPVMIFALCLTSVQVYLFWNAGYPPTYSTADHKITLTRDSMLNSSVVEIVQEIEKSPTFSLLKLLYGDNIRFDQLFMDSYKTGSIRVDFVSEDGKYYYQFSSSDGNQYHLSVSPHKGLLFVDDSANQTTQAIEQIDALGFNWYYNQAILIAENRTSNRPTLDTVNVNVVRGDDGLSVQVIGYQVTVSESGGINGQGVLISSFKPNGELNWMTNPA